MLKDTLTETELSKFKVEQWNRYGNIRQKTHCSKLAKQFTKLELTFNDEWFLNYANVEFPKESKWLLSMGIKFAIPINRNNFKPVPLIEKYSKRKIHTDNI